MNFSLFSDPASSAAATGLAGLALRALEQGRQVLALVEASSGGEPRISYVTPAFERLTGHSRADVRSKSLAQVLAPQPLPEPWLWPLQAFGAAPFRRVLPCVLRDGSVCSVDLHLFPLHEGPNPTAWAAHLTDITEHLQLHESLWQGEVVHHLLAENARELITVWASDGRCVFASPASQALLGRPPHALHGLNLTDLLHAEELFTITTALASHFEKPRETLLVHRLRKADEAYIWVESVVKTRPALAGERPEVVMSSRDITKRRAAERSLQSVHELLSTIYDAVPLGLCLVDTSGVISQCNRAFGQLFQLNRTHAVGHPATEYLPERDLQRAASTPGTALECECLDGEGRSFPTEITVVPLGENSGRLIMLSDLRDRRRLQEQMEDTRRLESLGTLAGGIAHDFNNMLAIILGYASMLRDAASDPVRLGHYADTIVDAGRRGAEVVRQLQLFANTQEADTIQTDVHVLLEDVISQQIKEWPETIRVERRFDAQDALLVIDPLQFAQAIEKLLDNARKAMPDDGTLVVRTSEIRQSTFSPGATSAETKNFLRITIQDFGKGMDAATRARMFDPFWAKNKGPEARGLGLAVVYGIIRAHRGMIEVESAVGHGTSVHLLMPRATPPAEALPTHSDPPFVSEEKKTILLVEDEADLGALWNDILPSQGWRVLWARDGEEAMRLFRQHRDEICLVFTDVGLPLVDGWQLSAAIRAECPTMPLLITSGAFGAGDRQRQIEAPVAYLPKPYIHTKALAQIRQLTRA